MNAATAPALLTLADLLVVPGMLQLQHPTASDVTLHVLAERHGASITFAAYADVRCKDKHEGESRVAELTGLTADCDVFTAIGMLESARGCASSWPTLTESLR